jgi:tripartite-type tricarboxylate transporter receptor subunit TctC
MYRLHLPAIAAASAIAASTPAAAQQDFYAGKTVTIVVSYAPGGGYDIYSRLLSRHLGNHIPGKPQVVVQNMPGAAGIVASNHVYNAAPRDGTVIAAVDQNIPMLQLLGGEGLRFDVARFNWLGIIASSNGLVMSWETSGIKTIEDAKARTVPMGATGSNDDAWVYAKTLNATIGTKFNLITGYQGTSAVNVAIERGEVAAMARSSYFGFQAQKPDWLRDKKVEILVQLGFEKQPELPDVPLLIDLMQTDEHRQIARLVTLPTAIGYSHWLAPEVPAGRVAALRQAYADALKDEAFLADAAKQNLVIRPKTAAEVEALINQATAMPEATRKRASAILEWK